VIRNELSKLHSSATKSILSSNTLSDLYEFTWDQLHHELAKNAPVLLTILQESTITRTPRANRKAIIGKCAVVLLKHHCFNMCLVQKILSLILYACRTQWKAGIILVSICYILKVIVIGLW